jgi:hypothetical protein
MYSKRVFQSLTVILAAMVPQLVSFAAISPIKKEISQASLVSVNFPPPPNRNNPKGTLPAATRGSRCTQKNKEKLSIVPLMPKDRVGTSFSANPTMYFYLPKNNGKSAKIILSEENGKTIYSQQFEIVKKSGWVKLNLPDNISLEENKTYKWEFSIVCSSIDRDYVVGAIERPKLTQEQLNILENAKMSANYSEKINAYIKLYLWNETIVTLDALKTSEPTKWKQEWTELLKSIGIQDANIIEAPFLEPLNIKN